MAPIESQIAGQARNAALWQNEVSSVKLDKLGFQKLEGATLKSAKTPEALINSKELFKAYFRTEVKAMTDGMSVEHAEAYSKVAEGRLSEILDKTFGKMEDRLLEGKSVSNPGKLMKEANKLATEFLGEMKSAAIKDAASDLRQQVAANKGELAAKPQLMRSDDGSFTLVRNAPQIENLVLKGGGAKGIGYAPALREMVNSGMLDGLKQVVGTSAGALTAVSVAVGQTPDELKALGDKDLKSMLGTDKSLRDVYPEIGFSPTAKHVARMLKPIFGTGHGEANQMIKTLDEVSASKVQEGLKAIDAKDPQALQTFATGYADRLNNEFEAKNGRKPNDDEKATAETVMKRLDTLMKDADFTADRSGKMVTFSDMRMLHALNPSQFKEIQLTGYDIDGGGGVIFNADNAGDLPVAFAARISMSHPLIASGIKLDPKFGFGDHTFSDGGISSNSPTEAVFGGNRETAITDGRVESVEKQQIREKTLLMIFDDKGKGYSSLHGPQTKPEKGFFGKIGDSIMGSGKSYVASNPEIVEDGKLDKKKEYSGGVNTFIVFHGNIGTLNTDATQDQKNFAEAISSLKTLEQINNRSLAPSALSVSSVDDAFKLLTDQDKQLLYMDGPPKRSDFSGKMAEDSFIAASALYDMVAKEMQV